MQVIQSVLHTTLTVATLHNILCKELKYAHYYIINFQRFFTMYPIYMSVRQSLLQTQAIEKWIYIFIYFNQWAVFHCVFW